MNQKFKKFTAISLAVLLGGTAAPASAFAQSFTEVEKANVTEAIADLAEQYAQNFEEYDALKTGVHEDITLTLDDAGRAILGFVAPVDFSWFNDLRLSADVSMEDSAQFMTAGLYMNDTKLATLEYFFDMANMEIYMKIPELRDGYIKVDYEEVMKQQQAALEQQQEALENQADGSTANAIDPAAEEALESLEDSPFNDPEFLKTYMEILTNLPEYMPQPDTFEELLNKYTAILFDHIVDIEGGETEALECAGLKADCTAYEGRLSPADAQAFAQKVLDTARADEEIKNILDKVNEKNPSGGNLYEDFVSALDEMAEELNEAAGDDSSYLSAKVWVNEDGEAVQRNLIQHDADGEESLLYSWLELKDGKDVRTALIIGEGDESFHFNGTGQIENGILTGQYRVAPSSESTDESIVIDVLSYDTDASREGGLYGSYSIGFAAETDAAADGETVNPLQNFQLLLDIASDKDGGDFKLTLQNAGAALGSLSVNAALGSTMEKPDFEDLADVYDSLDENAMNEYMAGADPTEILNNLVSAGMPEELLSQLLGGGTEPEALP